MTEDNPRVLLHNDNTADMAERLRDTFPDVDVLQCNSYADLPACIENHAPDVLYTVRFAGSLGFPRDAMFGPSGPRWIANGGAGTDHLGHWHTSRTTVTNAAGIAADMMAEYAMGCFLHFSLDVPGFQSDKAQRIWSARRVKPLKGKTLLIVGLGHTGRAMAIRAKAFGMRVIGTRATPRPMDHVDLVCNSSELHELLPQADYILISTPLIKSTRGLIGEAEVSAMKPGVILADVSRGTVLQETALLSGLRSGKIAAAALDVFETEPLPPDNALWDQSNVIISPHCSSVSDGWEDASFDLFLSNLDRWLNGRPLVNVVDPQRGY